ncbi:MAG: hypothetical protein HXS50_00510, partial [Theionarchaea archaeon]|nr:hypothetical protein [Theionarchaea archaeon]
EYRQRVLRLKIVDPGECRLEGDEIGLFLGKIDGSNSYGVRKIEPGELEGAKDGEKALVFWASTAETSPWYNNQAYLDTMSREAVAKFIEVTHDAYAREVGGDFGKAVPGIFTDEPNYGGYDVEQDGAHAPWTDSLPGTFFERYGYDLLEHLPEVFFRMEGEAFSKVRYDYRDCLTHLFVSSFAEQIGRWCEEHDILFTGHVLAEENLLSQTSVVGDSMRFYEFMQAPGIDILRGEMLTREGGFPPELATAKQCSSVKHQFGRKWMLSELYGCTGWYFDFEEHKAVGDWQAALGVNLRCQHLSYYTMLGQAKRDYPASISFQSPWWRDYPVVEDYFARVGVVITEGEAVRDIAVIHPIESAWGLFCGSFKQCKELWELNSWFEKVQKILLKCHFDFDYVDEEILSRHGSVDGGELKVAKASYRAVIVPPMLTIRSSTVELILKLLEDDVPVIFVEPLPTMIDAMPSDGHREMIERGTVLPLDGDEIYGRLSGIPDIRRVSIQDDQGMEFPDSLYMLRHDPETGRYLTFICHTDQGSPTGPLRIHMPGSGQVQEWDPETGRIYLADVEEGDKTSIRTEMSGTGSRIFVVDPKPLEHLKPKQRPVETRRETITTTEWDAFRDEPNAIPLDYAKFSVDGGDWQGPLEVLKVDFAIRDEMGIPHRGGRMAQPWVQKMEEGGEEVNVSLTFAFHVECMPHGPCHLVIEQPEKQEIFVNGSRLEPDQDEGWWIDPSFVRIRLPPGYLRLGENEILLKRRYGNADGIESLYLTGEFGARFDLGHAIITAPPTKLGLGDWSDQGLPCYTSSITYTTDFEPTGEDERVFLEVPKWEGVLVKIRVNGVQAGKIAWPPHEVEITGSLREGVNRLEIEVVGSRRNLLGPLHLTERYPIWTGSGQFITDKNDWTDEYVLLPYGLFESPVLSYRK